MKVMENKLNSSVSSSSSSTPVHNRQKEVPLQVQVSVLRLGCENMNIMIVVVCSEKPEGCMPFSRKKIQDGVLEISKCTR